MAQGSYLARPAVPLGGEQPYPTLQPLPPGAYLQQYPGMQGMQYQGMVPYSMVPGYFGNPMLVQQMPYGAYGGYGAYPVMPQVR